MNTIRCILLLGSSFALGVCAVDYVCSNDTSSHGETTPIELEDSAGDSAQQHASGWRRTDTGWVHTDDWMTSSSNTRQSTATHIHPSLLAAFVILVSMGGLLAFDPNFRRRQEKAVLSDRALIRNWARRLRDDESSYNCL